MYKTKPTEIDYCINTGKVRVRNDAGQKWDFKEIIVVDGQYYGVQKKDTVSIQPELSNFYMYSPGKSATWSIIGLVPIVTLIVGSILLVINGGPP